MLFALKGRVFSAAETLGLNAILLKSGWRGRRLLILCYHGISLDDEHEWSGLYMRAEMFHERLERIRSAGCAVLPLGPAVEMLYAGTLPPRAAVITFDDGFHDFYAKAWPLLRSFGWPATVYLSTYYCFNNLPVFDPMSLYLLWKGRGQRLSWAELGIDSPIGDAEHRDRLAAGIGGFCSERNLSAQEKNALLCQLAGKAGVDYASLCERRILHLMNPREAAELAGQGVDFQLHCHRHRVYRSRDKFAKEIEDNRDALRRIGVDHPTHFCYPGGFRLPEFPGWLAELGVKSATTCEIGMATGRSARYELPRLLDSPGIGEDYFSAWLSGLGQLLPARKSPPARRQLADDDARPEPAAY